MFELTRGEFITQIFLPLEINADWLPYLCLIDLLLLVLKDSLFFSYNKYLNQPYKYFNLPKLSYFVLKDLFFFLLIFFVKLYLPRGRTSDY
jgi:NADH:ubiquinone oxidoreductase subunit H